MFETNVPSVPLKNRSVTSVVDSGVHSRPVKCSKGSVAKKRLGCIVPSLFFVTIHKGVKNMAITSARSHATLLQVFQHHQTTLALMITALSCKSAFLPLDFVINKVRNL